MVFQFHINIYFYIPFHDIFLGSKRIEAIQRTKITLRLDVYLCNNADIFLLQNNADITFHFLHLKLLK